MEDKIKALIEKYEARRRSLSYNPEDKAYSQYIVGRENELDAVISDLKQLLTTK